MADNNNDDLNRVVSLRNRCNESLSPYLLAHADNATAWQLWGPETFQLARRLNRPLFLSIGYSTCHWCHLMARESFTDNRIAQLLNEKFIPVKVDREERPDINRQYMDYLQASSGFGGWPLNVLLTPDLQPFFGGTYWPRHSTSDSTGVVSASFEDVLLRVADSWRIQEQRCRENGAEAVRQLRQFSQEGNLGGREKRGDKGSGKSTPRADNQIVVVDGPDLDVLDESYQPFQARYDPVHGGFGVAPKFVVPPHLRHLLRLGSYATTVREIVGEEECSNARAMAVNTLEHMARGGIKDQLGNGFARFSHTRDWSCPYFEKLLSDNAQLLHLYTEAYLVTGSELFRDAADDVARYLTSSTMVSPRGGFHAAEDADSVHKKGDDARAYEGAFYVWSYAEFSQVLGADELGICLRYWGIREDGNLPPERDVGDLRGKNVLRVDYESIADLADELDISEDQVSTAIERGRKKLLAARNARPRPALDDKLIAAWNGLAISALARAGTVLGNSKYLAAATAAASCLRQDLYASETPTLRRFYREGPGKTPGFAEDYAFVISGLLDLYEATSDASYLQLAGSLQQTQLSLFWDEDNAGFFSTRVDQLDILVRTKDGLDTSEPSTNSVSACNLFRLAALLHDRSYAARGRATVAAFEVEISTHPDKFSGMMPAIVASRLGVRCLLLPPAPEPRRKNGEGSLSNFAVRAFHASVIPTLSLLCMPSSSERRRCGGR